MVLSRLSVCAVRGGTRSRSCDKAGREQRIRMQTRAQTQTQTRPRALLREGSREESLVGARMIETTS